MDKVNYKTRPSVLFAKEYFKAQIDVAVEVGVWSGINGFDIRRQLAPKKMYFIDPLDSTIQECRDNKTVLLSRIALVNDSFFIQKKSHESIYDMQDEIDFVYIDARHDYENVKRDILSWFPKIKLGGVLAGHDFNDNAVRSAVETMFETYSDKMIHGNHDWWVIKK